MLGRGLPHKIIPQVDNQRVEAENHVEMLNAEELKDAGVTFDCELLTRVIDCSRDISAMP